MASISGQRKAEAGFAGYADPSVRGACPSLAAPMQTGDGLLVRLRPSTPGLTVSQFRELAHSASVRGNGLIEITARGNIQIRGLSTETMQGLAEDLDRAGIIPESGLTIETSPLSGRDPTEIADARAMAAQLRASLPAGLILAAKLTVIVDGRGLFDLDSVPADIRLVTVSPERWEVSVGGVGSDGSIVSVGTAEQALASVVGLLRTLDAIGPRARGRDLVTGFKPAKPLVAVPPKSFLGVHSLGDASFLVGMTPRYGQIDAERLGGLLDIVAAHGVKEILTAPGHVLLFPVATHDAAMQLQAAALTLGFETDPTAPFLQIASCSGQGACASGHYRTKDLAADLVSWIASVFDGSILLHLSGCPKGCAHPAVAPITIVGMGERYGIVLGGKASDEPAIVADKIHLKSALQRLAALVGDSIVVDESVKACLERLGGEAIAVVLRQE